ncbi:MAG TPA: hypothetical protein DCQ84_06110, partial [Candidatus Competibacteraceae bacterium]|nr:hypothetical protein [Candidatus Competibacteraceae bacterium]
ADGGTEAGLDSAGAGGTGPVNGGGGGDDNGAAGIDPGMGAEAGAGAGAGKSTAVAGPLACGADDSAGGMAQCSIDAQPLKA